MKMTLRLTGLIGLALFAALFGLTYGVPETVENSAKTFVKDQVEKEVSEKLTPLAESSLAKKAKNLADKLGIQESQLKQDLINDLPGKIADIMAKMCGYDCEKKKQMAERIKFNYMAKLKNLQIGKFNLTEIVKGKYIEIVNSLRADIRIFTFSNALMFLLLLSVSFLKPAAIQHLFVPGLLLFSATMISAGFYVFGQNWFYTIIYNDYMGWAYLVYLSIVSGFLFDIVLNQCRVTCEVFNFITDAISSIELIEPC